jgi:hypothetical protein
VPTVPEVAPIVWDYGHLPGNGCGGSLHIVLDDENIEDEHVRFCIDYALANGDLAGARLGAVLLSMSKTQRLKLSGTYYKPQRP